MEHNQSSVRELPVREYVPHAGLAGIRAALSSLVTGFGAARELAWRFFLRDTRAAYRQSALGYVWMFLPPLVNTLLWVLLNRSEVISIDSGGVPYPLFVLAGTILFGAFNSSVMATMGVVGQAGGMLAKVNFPHESLVYNALFKSLLDAFVPAILLVPGLIMYKIQPSATMLLFPLALCGTVLFGLACGLILVPIGSLYSDVGRAVQLALRLSFFVTPVIFPLPQEGLARTLMSANPLSALIVSGRSWLAGAGEILPVAFTVVMIGSLLLALLGLVIYKVAMPHLIERLSS